MKLDPICYTHGIFYFKIGLFLRFCSNRSRFNKINLKVDNFVTHVISFVFNFHFKNDDNQKKFKTYEYDFMIIFGYNLPLLFD